MNDIPCIIASLNLFWNTNRIFDDKNDQIIIEQKVFQSRINRLEQIHLCHHQMHRKTSVYRWSKDLRYSIPICRDNLTMIALSSVANIEYRDISDIEAKQQDVQIATRGANNVFAPCLGKLRISSDALSFGTCSDTSAFRDVRYSKQHSKWLYLSSNI